MSIIQTIMRGPLRNEDPEGGGGGDDPPIVDPSVPPTFDATGIFDADGKFGDIGEKYGNDEVDPEYINRYMKGKTPGEVAKILKDNQTAARQKALSYPGEDADDAQREAWKAGALVPEVVEQVMPEDFESFQNATGWTPEVATPVLQALIDAGTPGPAITAALNAVQEAAATQGEAWAQQAQEANESSQAEVREAFGSEADDRINGAVTAAEKLGLKAGLSQEQIDDVKAGVQEIRNPAITRMFAHLADAVRDAQYRGAGGQHKADEFSGPKETADAIMNDSSHPMHEKYIAGDDKVHEHVDRLLHQAAKLAS